MGRALGRPAGGRGRSGGRGQPGGDPGVPALGGRPPAGRLDARRAEPAPGRFSWGPRSAGRPAPDPPRRAGTGRPRAGHGNRLGPRGGPAQTSRRGRALAAEGSSRRPAAERSRAYGAGPLAACGLATALRGPGARGRATAFERRSARLGAFRKRAARLRVAGGCGWGQLGRGPLLRRGRGGAHRIPDERLQRRDPTPLGRNALRGGRRDRAARGRPGAALRLRGNPRRRAAVVGTGSSFHSGESRAVRPGRAPWPHCSGGVR